MSTKSEIPPELAAYHKECEAMLGGGNSEVLIGLLITLAVFIFLISLPWTMDYLQNQGTIKPRIYFNPDLEPQTQLRTRNVTQ